MMYRLMFVCKSGIGWCILPLSVCSYAANLHIQTLLCGIEISLSDYFYYQEPFLLNGSSRISLSVQKCRSVAPHVQKLRLVLATTDPGSNPKSAGPVMNYPINERQKAQKNT